MVYSEYKKVTLKYMKICALSDQMLHDKAAQSSHYSGEIIVGDSCSDISLHSDYIWLISTPYSHTSAK